MKLVKVESKIYIWDEDYETRIITYTLKYLRSSKRVTFQSIQDCFDLDEVLFATNVSLAAELDNHSCFSESVYIPEFRLCVLKPFYESN
jgi:hypothetical protein